MPIDTFKNIPYIGTHEKIPGEAAIKEILAKMGKTSPEQELNCGSCGYPVSYTHLDVYKRQHLWADVHPCHGAGRFRGPADDVAVLCGHGEQNVY